MNGVRTRFRNLYGEKEKRLERKPKKGEGERDQKLMGGNARGTDLSRERSPHTTCPFASRPESRK